MASSPELNLESVRDYMILKGGKVTNHELVRHFKDVLTNPETRAEARNEFKEIVNTLATIVRNSDSHEEKYLVLKKRFRNPETSRPVSQTVGLPSFAPDIPPYPTLVHPRSGSSSALSNYSTSQDSFENFFAPTIRQPPPYRPPPPPVSPSSISAQQQYINQPNGSQISPSTSLPSSQSVSSLSSLSDLQLYSPVDTPRSPTSYNSEPPPVPPRRKSCEKLKMDNKENVIDFNKRPKTIGAESPNENDNADPDANISVKECMQKFNRLASETSLLKNSNTNISAANIKKKSGKETPDRDEEDCVSLNSAGPKGKEWLVKASQSDYQALAKLASENNTLTRLKCPFTGYTALHWAAKHGNEDAVKLLAGTHKLDVNGRTNGGYTALHIAMQFGHQDIYNLLVEVYGADSNIRDYSGKKPRQYLTNKDTTVSTDTFLKIKARKKMAEKDLGFLRIGSLNVRVKKTTEAFSNFLGVGHSDKIHKSWGSADNIPLDDQSKMPPPKFAPIKKRKSRRAQDFRRPTSQQNLISDNMLGTRISNSGADSDSDTAAGFGTNWQSTV